MKRKICFICCLGIVCCLGSMILACKNPAGGGGNQELPPRYIYVTDIINAGGPGDGSSWAKAMNDVQAAIDLAAGFTGTAKPYVLIKEGTYIPTRWPNGGSGDNDKHFSLKNGVIVIGGFDGDETGIVPAKTNPTILSGDVLGDDMPGNLFTNKNDNVRVFYHPLGLNLTASAELRNVTVSGGYAGFGLTPEYGGGMYNIQSSPTITNCIFSENFADNVGGSIFNQNCGPVINNCTFLDNYSAEGAGIFNDEANPKISNCTFINNVTSADGGAIYNMKSNFLISNCTFSLNNAFWGGAIKNYFSNPIIENCTFSGNSANSGGAIYNYEDSDGNTSNPVITNCTFSGNNASNTGGGIYNADDCHPQVYGTIIVGNTAATIPNADENTFDSSSGNNFISDIDISLIFVNVSSGKAVLEANGGPTETLMVKEVPDIQITLPINGWTVPPKDQRGAVRAKTGNIAYMGAVDPRVTAP